MSTYYTNHRCITPLFILQIMCLALRASFKLFKICLQQSYHWLLSCIGCFENVSRQSVKYLDNLSINHMSVPGLCVSACFPSYTMLPSLIRISRLE